MVARNNGGGIAAIPLVSNDIKKWDDKGCIAYVLKRRTGEMPVMVGA